MIRYAYFLTNGIRTFPGASKNWNGRGVTHIHTHGQFQQLECVAEKIEYFCTAVSRAFGQKDRVEKLYRTSSFYSDNWRQIHVAHSNGAAVVVDMVRRYNCVPIDTLHLVCAACDADFERNLLNAHLRSGKIKRVVVYVAGKDRALRLASNWIGRLLGYGVLGLHGPRRVATDVRDRVDIVRWINYGHSTCWADENFEGTMGFFLPESYA